MNLPTGAFSFTFFIGSDQGPNCQLRTYQGNVLFHASGRPFGTQQFLREAELIACNQAELIRLLEPCTRWNRTYYNTQVRNGEQWELVIRLNGKEIKSYGCNAYPDDFENVVSQIECLIGKSIPYMGRGTCECRMAA